MSDPTQQIDSVCDAFEAAWKSGTPPRLEDHLCRVLEETRPALFRELLALEREYRARAGRPLQPAEACARFTNLGPWAEQVVAELFPLEPTLLLDVTDGPHAGLSVELAGRGTFTLGRQPGLHVTLADDKSLSRVHCVIEPTLRGARVTDLGSSGGTFVNKNRITTPCDISEEDEVRTGLTAFRVRPSHPQDDTTLALDGGTTPARAVPLVPPVIPGYRIGDELGRGNMGVVYRAVRESNGETVAVKTILPAVAVTPIAVGRFCREADILGRLTHPHIVGHLGSGAAGPLLYVVMEYVAGPTAATVVAREGALKPERVLGWAVQLLDALAHAHQRGFVHRDVKPGNLLVTTSAGSEAVKLSDFGLARNFESCGLSGLTTDGTTGGTAAFMPPEQVTDFRQVRPAADQYAAAATLYYLLIGSGVYEPAAKVGDALGRILTMEPIPLRPDAPPLPDPFGPVIRRALARDPLHRFPDVSTMARALTE